MAITKLNAATPLVLVGKQTGLTIIPAQTPLTRLNYFDGKFLRAEDLQAEQNYLRQLTQFSNQANGFGVVNGFNLTLGGGDRLDLGAGLAIDPRGRVLLLGQEQTVSIQDLIDKSRELQRLLKSSTLNATGGFADCEMATAAPSTAAVAGREWYLLTISHAEALCGEEDVYGKLCQEACVTSTDRPYRLEGVILRALPLLLSTPLVQSAAVKLDRTHLRSLIASAFYADEADRVGDLISRAGLEATTWCNGALGLTGNDVALGVLVRDGNSTLFLDQWIARRELMETSPRRYWQWRMAMRPWDVYLAQILQFQCQLHHKVSQTPADSTGDDPCAEAKQLVDEAAKHFQVLSAYYKQTTSKLQKMSKTVRERMLEDAPELAQSSEQYAAFDARLQQASKSFALAPQNRLLINWGIVETPSAGYLPIVPGDTISVNAQVRRLMGEGVDLRFCIVRPDFVPHALEEAQHMERISLLRGLDNPNDKPKVDVLVPYGKIVEDHVETGRYYEMRMNLIEENLLLLVLAVRLAAAMRNQKSAASIAAAAGASSTDTAELLKQYVAALTRDTTKSPLTFEYTGAARASASGESGIEFYYAGNSKPLQLGTQRASGTAPAPAASAGIVDATGNPISAGAATAARSSINESISEAMMSRMRASTARINTNATAAAAAPATRDIEARSSIWVALTMAKDPTELNRNQSTAVKAECYLQLTMQATVPTTDPATGATTTKTATVTTVVRAAFNGELSVDELATRGGVTEQREVKGTLSGELTFSARTSTSASAASGEPNNFSLYLSEPLIVQRTQGTQGPLFKIEAPNWSFLQPLIDDMEVERKWTAAQKAEAVGTIEFMTPSATAVRAAATLKSVARQAFRAWQTINANVQEPQHAAHEDAIRALRSIAGALGTPKFADVSALRLFPAPLPKPSELNVFATQDWVLFHRRREKTCQYDQPTTALAVRRYALYQVELTGDQTLADLRKQLERTAANAKLPTLDFVQLVEFGAGIHAVISPHAQVLASWRQDVGTDAGDVIGGFIASHGIAAAEGERLAIERIESLADVIEPAPTGLSRTFDVLSRVPDALNAVSNDGVIVLVTRAEVTTNCVTVVAVENEDNANSLVEAAREGKFKDALAGDKLAKTLGVVNFSGSTPNAPQLATVLQAWNALDYKPASGAAVIANASDPAAATYTAQANALLAGLGGTGVALAAATPEILSACPAVTLIVGSVQYRNVLYIYGNWDRPNHFLQPNAPKSTGSFRNNLEQGDALENFIAQLTPNQPVSGVTLTVPTGAPDAGANARLQEVLQRLTASGRPMPAATRRVTQALNANDRQQLVRIGINPDDFDDVIFFELNAGA